MAKLFKTISLEDRYKNSNHFNQIAKPKSVMQGTIVLQAVKSIKEFESILLKSLPSAQEKNSIILKSIKGNVDVTKRAPAISLVFRSPIGLVDRIKQPHTKPQTKNCTFVVAFHSQQKTDWETPPVVHSDFCL